MAEFSPLSLYDIEKHVKPQEIGNLMSMDGILSQFRDVIVPKINEHGMKLYIVPVPLGSSGMYYSGYSDHYLEENQGEEWNQTPFILLNIFLNSDLSIDKAQPVEISFDLDIDKQQFLADILVEQFPYNYVWNGISSRKMKINFQQQTNKIEKIMVSQQSDYPLIWITGNLEENEQVPNGLRTFEGFALQKASELKSLLILDKEVNLIEWEYTEDEFKIAIIGIKDEDLNLFKTQIQQLRESMTLTIENTHFKINQFEADLYQSESNFDNDDYESL
jgi:hypothetical protein